MFETVSKLGEGSYAKVYLVRKKGEQEVYALKQVDKMQIIKHDKVDSVHRERDILMIARHPNIVHLDCTFSDERHLYYLLEYAENRSLAELLKLISRSKVYK
jgi:serine/threonine protein kinase